jgi:hypothetical protein
VDTGFRKRSCSSNKLERDDDSKKSHLALAAGVTALFIGASPLAYAQAPFAQRSERVSADDLGALTEVRIHIVKAALELTPDQEKLWPAVESGIRARAKNRQARIAADAKRLDELRDRSPIEILRDRDPVAFMQRRAEALAQRAADLKKVADAWQPLYQTLTPDQRRRMGLLTIYVLREMRNVGEQRRTGWDDDEG